MEAIWTDSKSLSSMEFHIDEDMSNFLEEEAKLEGEVKLSQSPDKLFEKIRTLLWHENKNIGNGCSEKFTKDDKHELEYSSDNYYGKSCSYKYKNVDIKMQKQVNWSCILAVKWDREDQYEEKKVFWLLKNYKEDSFRIEKTSDWSFIYNGGNTSMDVILSRLDEVRGVVTDIRRKKPKK